MNKTIKQNLKTELEDLKGRWADELPKVLWAYKTTATSTTSETLFSLSYGYEAIVSIEIGAGSLWRKNYNPEQNETLQKHVLDFIEEKQRDSQIRVTVYRRRTTRYLYSKVKTRRFQIWNLFFIKVLYNKEALHPKWEGWYKIAGILTQGAYQLAHLNGDRVPRSWNTDHLKMYYQ